MARPKAKAKSAAGPLPSRARSSSAATVAYASSQPPKSRGRSASIASAAETVNYNQDDPIVPEVKQGRGRPRKDSVLAVQALAAALKVPATPAKILVEQRAASAIPSAAAPSKKPRIRTVSLGGEVTLPIAKKRPKKTANVTLPTVGYMPIRRAKNQAQRPGVPYGARNSLRATERKQLVDESSEFLNV